MPGKEEIRWDSKTPPQKSGNNGPKNKGGTPPPPQDTREKGK